MSSVLLRSIPLAARPAASALPAALLVVLAACSGVHAGGAGPIAGGAPIQTGTVSAPTQTPEPAASTSTAAVPSSATFTIVAAGDIARRPQDGQHTAALIDDIDPDAVLTLGDNAYESGRLSEYQENYDPTWGRFLDITYPVPGNHEYRTDGAAGYFAYFGDRVHGRPYYAWTAAGWRFYALNCEIDCEAGSAQLSWLQRDVHAHRGQPMLAYIHQPRFTCSTKHGPQREVDDLWRALQQADGRIMLAGHNHAYERFAPLDVNGSPDADGLRQFVVGTGGVRAYPLQDECSHRAVGYDSGPGVLRLDLSRTGFSWQFVAAGGRVVDAGSASL